MLFYVTGKEQGERSVSIQERGVKEGRKTRQGEERKGCDLAAALKIIIPIGGGRTGIGESGTARIRTAAGSSTFSLACYPMGR